jgi:predicted RNA binding protein YcfA (HicA-like mRNA interferase family)
MAETEIIFNVEESPEGGYEARGLGFSIYTQADTLDELKAMVQDAALPLRARTRASRHPASLGEGRGHPRVKLRRDLDGKKLASLLRLRGYQITRQTGSHIRLTSSATGAEHHVTVPAHREIRVGTLTQFSGTLPRISKCHWTN